jgi:hypothetical protein
MPINNTTEITAPIATSSLTDTYNTHFEEMGEGGYRSVADITARNNIPVPRRKSGMEVRVLSTDEVWILNTDLVTWRSGNVGASLTLTGDITGSGASPINTTLANSGVLAGTYAPLASQKVILVVDSKGRITSATNQNIQIPESAVTGLVGKYIPVTEKGVAGGVATLDGGGHVPAAQLNLSLLNLINTWNATTNTPALADGVGTVGDGYIVTVAGTQNLGSGSQTFAVGDMIVYFGVLDWLKVATTFTGIQQITTDAGVLTGAAITMDDTSYLAPSTDRQYNTDDEKDALDNSVTPLTAANPAVSQADLTAAIAGINLTVSNEFNSPERYEDGLNSLGENTISPQFMNTLTNPVTGVAYTTASMLAAYPLIPGSWTAATTTYSDACVETAFRSMELAFGSAAIIFHDNRIYQYNKSHAKPGVSQWSSFWKPDSWVFQGNGSRHFNISGIAQPIWYRIPPNQTVAFGGANAWTGYKTLMYNLSMYGANLGIRDSGDTCLIDCASYGSYYQNCVFTSADIGVQFYGTLLLKLIGGSMAGNSRSGIKSATGFNDGVSPPMWTGASLTNSASNGSFFSPSNINCPNGSFAGIEVYGSNGVSICGDAQAAFEGTGGTMPEHHIFFDGQMSALVKMFTARNYHLEQSVSVSHVCIKDYGQVVTAYLGEMSPFLTVAGEAMFEARTNPAGGGTVQMIIRDCPNLDVGWKLRQIGTGSSGRWTIYGCQLFDENNIYNTLNWSQTTIAGLTGSIPPNISATSFAQIIAKTN